MFGIDPATVLVLLSAFGALAVVAGVGLPIVQRIEVNSRLKNVRAKRDELRRQQKESFQTSTLREQFKKKSLSAVLLEKLHLQELTRMEGLRRMMAQAGWRDRAAPSVFIFAHLISPALFAAVAALMIYDGDMVQIPERFELLAVIGAGLLGLALPFILLKNAVDKRRQKLAQQFPDSLDLLLICVQAGLSLEAAFARVTAEMGERAGVIAEEFGLTAAELAFLGDRRLAFEHMHTRTGISGFRSLATTLIQAERYGTSVAMSLRILSDESRRERELEVEKKAGALPAKLTVPMIAFFLPVLLMVIVGPAVIQVMNQ